jgi:CsoR family transcriptional regulator, copper-sensing transcriptional repressor
MTGELAVDPAAAGGRPALASSAAGAAGRWSARRRLQTARGHVDAVMRMLEADRYCVDILHQLSAVEAAITRARQDVLDGHLRGCVADALATGVISAGDVADEVRAAVFGGAAPAAGSERRAVR